jgi:hypothetical protein
MKTTIRLSPDENSDRRRLSPTYAAAARRSPIPSAIDDPTSDALIIASLFTTAWNRPPHVASDKPKREEFKRQEFKR